MPAASAPSLVAVLTFTLWCGCLAIGWVGLTIPYASPVSAPAEVPPVEATLLHVELSSEPLPMAPVTPPREPELAEPPPLKPVAQPAPPPALMTLVQPSPAMAFPVPVRAPSPVVQSGPASVVQPAEPVVAASPAPAAQPITYGQGEGRQPAPEYPRQAIRERQEGVVQVRFTVDEQGRVRSAEAVSPSPWPLLNHSALRAVRERWRFQPGTLRFYEVAIRFELKK